MLSRRMLLAGLFASVAAAPFASLDEAEAQEIRLRVGPPAPRRERRPPPRRGFVWVPGHWEWRRGRYVWVDGRWERERRGQRWRDARWVRRRGEWVFVPGGWIR